MQLSTDVSAGFERTLTLARADAIGAAVQDWLGQIMAGANPPDLA